MKEYDLSPLGHNEIHQRHYFHLACMEDTPERWISYEENPSDGSPAPIELEFYWVEYSDQVPPLSGWLDDYLPKIEIQMTLQNLSDILKRDSNPTPWSEGDNIPWNEPGFSQRMLEEHLTQDHDMASRRLGKVEQHVAWIHQEALGGQPGKLLDLGCGPGLYSGHLTDLGHQVSGIDYSPASITYAREQATLRGQAITFIHADIREADYGSQYDAAMLIFGETNVFRPADIRKILEKIYAALKLGGKLILEPHTFEAIEEIGNHPASWFTSEGGLFSPYPHLVLTENFWDEEQKAATIRHFVVDAASGNVIRYAQSMQAYTQEEYSHLLAAAGFDDIHFYPSLTGIPDPEQEALIAITAIKTSLHTGK